MAFSEKLQNWLSLNASYILGDIIEDSLGNRSLGPASGEFDNLYPFLNQNSFTTVLTGLSIEGLDQTTGKVYLKEYKSVFGCDRDFSDIPWQGMIGSEWMLRFPNLSIFSSDNQSEFINELDLVFEYETNGVLKIIDTKDLEYSNIIYGKYKFHQWKGDITIIAMTYEGIPENNGSFLRPRYIQGKALIDPVCLYNNAGGVRLHSGRVLITGEIISGNPNINRVFFSRDLEETENSFLITLKNSKANKFYDCCLQNDNCYSVYAFYEENQSNVITISNEVNLGNFCSACCSCPDYSKAYKILTGLFNLQRNLISKYNTLHDKYLENVERLKEYIISKKQIVQGEIGAIFPSGNGNIETEIFVTITGTDHDSKAGKNIIKFNEGILTYVNPPSVLPKGMSLTISSEDNSIVLSNVRTNYIGKKSFKITCVLSNVSNYSDLFIEVTRDCTDYTDPDEPDPPEPGEKTIISNTLEVQNETDIKSISLTGLIEFNESTYFDFKTHVIITDINEKTWEGDYVIHFKGQLIDSLEFVQDLDTGSIDVVSGIPKIIYMNDSKIRVYLRLPVGIILSDISELTYTPIEITFP